MNLRHGHVLPNPDGSKARCGGPALCAVCQREQATYGPRFIHSLENKPLFIMPCSCGKLYGAETEWEVKQYVAACMKRDHVTPPKPE